MAGNRGRRGPIWDALRALVFAEETHCWLCGERVDQTIPAPDRWSRSVDHVIPVDLRPDLIYRRSNVRLAHRGCNSSAGATYGNHIRKHGRRPVLRRL